MKSNDSLKAWLIVGAILLAISVGCCLVYRTTESTATITVSKAERVTSGKSSYYLVWSQQGEVYTVADSWAYLQWDASDRYGKLEVGKTYNVKVAGWRWNFLSWYRNVLSVEEQKAQ